MCSLDAFWDWDTSAPGKRKTICSAGEMGEYNTVLCVFGGISATGGPECEALSFRGLREIGFRP